MFDTNQQFDNECPDCREWEQEVERLKEQLEYERQLILKFLTPWADFPATPEGEGVDDE